MASPEFGFEGSQPITVLESDFRLWVQSSLLSPSTRNSSLSARCSLGHEDNIRGDAARTITLPFGDSGARPSTEARAEFDQPIRGHTPSGTSVERMSSIGANSAVTRIRVLPASVPGVIAEDREFLARIRRTWRLENRRLRDRNSWIMQVLISRTLSVCGLPRAKTRRKVEGLP